MYFLLLIITIFWLTKDNNLVCLIHALATSCISISRIPYLIDPSTNITDSNSLGAFCASLTLQYMVFDLVNVLNKLDFLLHHILAIMASCFVLYFQVYETLVLYIELNEISTIFLSLASMKIFRAFSRPLFVICFILFRIVWLLWVLLNKNTSSLFIYSMLYVHYALQVYWLHKIYKLMVARRNL